MTNSIEILKLILKRITLDLNLLYFIEVFEFSC